MEAPEKIYLQPISKNEIYNHWYRDKLTNDFIEYFRTDAFIEKACDAYCKVCKMPNCRRNECKFIIEFKSHLEII